MKIVTDCAADLTPEEILEYDIAVAPLYIQFPEGEVSALDITPDDFYDRLRAMVPNIPTTAQPSPGVFVSLYEKLATVGEEILSIHISSGLSGTLQSARTGAAQAVGVAVELWDTMTLSGGERFQVLAAARAARAGWSKQAILERLQQLRQSIEVVYTLDTLTYLARGGRIGRVQALAGALLNLKPVIRVEHKDGKYSTVAKARTMQKALVAIVEHLKSEYGDTALWISVVHGQFAEQAQLLSELARQHLNVGRMEMMRISPVLGVHTGPGIVGITAAPMKLLEDI